MDKEKIKFIANLNLFLGIIGSFILAFRFGKTLDTEYPKSFELVSNWPLTISLLFGSLLSVYILYIILMALYSIMENQEYIIDALSTSPSPVETISQPLKSDQWRCNNCNTINQTYITTCLCGSPKK